MRCTLARFGVTIATLVMASAISSCNTLGRPASTDPTHTRFATPSTALRSQRALGTPTTPRRVVIPTPSGAVSDPSNRFRLTSETISPAISQRITGISWRPGCPVPLSQLRYVRLSYWGFDGVPHTGELIIHSDAVAAITTAFRRAYASRFPIDNMRLIDEYGGDDDRSTQANNTSAFNCRAVTGGGRWSQHSYGRAIDINPLQNPYVYSDGHVLDPAARPYVDRSVMRKGMIVSGDVITTAFAEAGWGWGGNFKSFKDYQHFSANGG